MKLLVAFSFLLPSALALTTGDDRPLEKRFKAIFGDIRKAESEIATLGSSKADAHTKQLMKRLEGEVDEALPDELRKLSEVFHDEERKTGVVKVHRRATGERAPHVERIMDKLAKRRFNRHEDRSGCGAKFTMSEMGFRPEAAQFFKKSFLQGPDEEEEEGSFTSKPGSGADQKFADNGRSIMGKVAGEEVLVTVYKDGFFGVGCIADSMFKSGDKFGGANKPNYKEDLANVSIALYSELVLKDAQKPMTPHTCFEFCRSMDGMSFFGIKNGRDCYCMPYYKSTTGSGMCDLPCPGDDMQICGGMVKSSVFEMHTCGDRGQALTAVAASAGEALSAFYAAALFSGRMSEQLQKAGAKLQELGGLSGSPTTGDYGQTAKKYAGEAGHVLMDGECMESYDELLMVYEESEGTSLLDMKKAVNLARLEESAGKMEKQTPKVAECAKKAGKATEQGYPAYGASIEAKSEDDFKAHEEAFATTLAQYYPLMYALDNKKTPMQSVCDTVPVGNPAVGTVSECAEACDAMVFPPEEKCTGFQFFDTGDEMPVCFLFKEIKKANLFDCEFITEGNKALSEEKKGKFLQQESIVEEQRVASKIIQMEEEGKDDDDKKELPKVNEGHCSAVKASVMYTGSTCKDLFGEGHSVIDTCPDVCKKSDGAKILATCYLKLSEISAGMKMFKIMEEKRCFGGKENEDVAGSGVDSKLVPFDDQGAVLAGDATIGGKTVSEPVIWAAPEEEA
jgi:hypothetical protein